MVQRRAPGAPVAGDARARARSGRAARSRRSRLRDAAALDFRVGADGEVWFLSATAIPSFDPRRRALRGDARRRASITTRRSWPSCASAAARHGLTALLDATKPRPPRARRTSLRVGLAFNMKRIDSHAGDDREAEYDAPETIQAITQAIESHGHVVVPLEATPDFPRALIASNVDVVFNIAEGMAGRSREAQVPEPLRAARHPVHGQRLGDALDLPRQGASPSASWSTSTRPRSRSWSPGARSSGRSGTPSS